MTAELSGAVMTRILRLYAEQRPIAEVSALTGVPRHRVRNFLAEEGVLRRSGRTRDPILSADEQSAARARYRSGSTIREVAAAFNVSYGTIWHLIRGHARPHGGPR